MGILFLPNVSRNYNTNRVAMHESLTWLIQSGRGKTYCSSPVPENKSFSFFCLIPDMCESHQSLGRQHITPKARCCNFKLLFDNSWQSH